ncbi:hypothetical protein Enr13x_57860 [Stieleria neptunia]|uniref:Uncharacterized protein n=1 Tax=Stieleria neptunia TaxID=2527979 RepID=A0A518HYF3_9BACT|nr:hypothetical protein [Stieleria neptunia]QDV45883.1 hypothetical protein Enr13x_57860 [Stieleria neptunia]
MQNHMLSHRFVEFVEHVQATYAAGGRMLQVLDLRLACRAQRLTEYPDWSTSDLELIEREAARYRNETELSQVLSGEAAPELIEVNSWMNSPSPFAWT